MHQSYILILVALATSINSLPLNINLGAYSPALVVGDGEISFGGGVEAASLISTLQGTAGTAAGTEAATAKAAEIAKATAAEESVVIAPGDVASTSSTIPLVGMGKAAVAPREPKVDISDVVAKEKRSDEEKRDIAGFNAALAFATAALTKGPTIELGTGEGGSGVGITVKHGAVARDLGETTIEKRDGRDGPTVTLLKIRSLGDSTSAEARRDESSAKRGIEVDEDGNLGLDLDGEVELVIAEVKA